MEDSDSEQVIGRWVENYLQMEVINTGRIYKLRHLQVENT
jgi:hypothetical protein